jgi:hypothetical protein
MLPIEPLFKAYGRPWREFRLVVGARHSTLMGYKESGMPLDVADKYAVKCGYHPVEIWGYDTWLKALEDYGYGVWSKVASEGESKL